MKNIFGSDGKPANATIVSDKLFRHPRDTVAAFYRLIRFTATGRYALLDPAGGVRTVSQTWARKQEKAR